jgi:hypothetical protein
MTPEALAAEKLAREFGLTYLSPEGFEKLARLIAWVRADKPLPQPEQPPDIVRSKAPLIG